VTKAIRILTALVFMLPLVASAREFKTEPTVVELSGRFECPPFTEEETAKQGVFYTIHLDTPIDVASDEYGNQVKGIDMLQLVFLGTPEETRMLVDGLGQKRIRVTGTLFHAITGHHRTKVLVTVNTIVEMK
jgi:hypothetical protein